MRKLLLILLMLLLIGLSGCTPMVLGGPLVTDIAYDGEGNLVITKNSIMYDPFWGSVFMSDNPQTIVIKSRPIK